MKLIRKIGYIRTENAKGSTSAYYAYEDLMINESLRKNVSLICDREYLRMFCCCREEHQFQVFINEDGIIHIKDKDKHDPECIRFQSRMNMLFQSTSLIGTIYNKSALRADFSWDISARRQTVLPLSDHKLLVSKAMSFSDFVFFLNSTAFSSRGNSRSSIQPGEKLRQISEFMFRMSTRNVFNPKLPDKGPVNFGTQMAYDHLLAEGTSALFYGYLLPLSDEQLAGKGKYIFLKAIGYHGRSAFFRVNRDDFIRAYDFLPVLENVWICGFIRCITVAAELPQKGMGIGDISPTKMTHTYVKTELARKEILEMKFGRLFSCNDAGLIVFNKEEYTKSNAAIGEGKQLFRSLIGTGDSSWHIMIYNNNGEDHTL